MCIEIGHSAADQRTCPMLKFHTRTYVQSSATYTEPKQPYSQENSVHSVLCLEATSGRRRGDAIACRLRPLHFVGQLLVGLTHVHLIDLGRYLSTHQGCFTNVPISMRLMGAGIASVLVSRSSSGLRGTSRLPS